MIVFNCGKTRLYLLKISLFFKTENRLFDKIDTDLKNIYIYYYFLAKDSKFQYAFFFI